MADGGGDLRLQGVNLEVSGHQEVGYRNKWYHEASADTQDRQKHTGIDAVHRQGHLANFCFAELIGFHPLISTRGSSGVAGQTLRAPCHHCLETPAATFGCSKLEKDCGKNI
jgi:hypothetical protein